MCTYKHLSREERNTIEQMLNERSSFSHIAKTLGRHCSTISNEIRNHIHFRKSGCHGSPFNDCLNRVNCSNIRLCSKSDCKIRLCRYCPHCSKYCADYIREQCTLLYSPPYVCNGCLHRSRCTLEKRFYSAAYAQKECQQINHESRCGISLSEEELRRLDDFLSPLIRQGQSIQHIMASNPTFFTISKRTIYNYIDAGLLSVKNIDLPRKVRYRSRKKLSSRSYWSYRIGRTYEDYKQYRRSKPGIHLVELDSVEGKKGGKVLLTIHFVESQFMLAYLRDRNTANSVTEIFNRLYRILGPEIFRKLFPLLLADNGNEFSDPEALEQDASHNQRTRVFYCKALAPYQKGAAENNHEFIRRILPKGTSFNDLTQQNIDLIMNHINSYNRAKLGYKSPYESFRDLYGREILDTLGIHYIPPNEIILRPALLRKYPAGTSDDMSSPL